MNGRGFGYTAAVAVVGLTVGLAGAVMAASDEARFAVMVGSAVGVLVQVVIFWGLFVLLLPNKALLAHGLGILVRFAAVFAVAIMGASVSTMPLAPILFSLVTCLFISTLLEAAFVRGVDAGGISTDIQAVRNV